MSATPAPGALLARRYDLRDGTRVRLRLVHRSDAAGLAALLDRSDPDATGLDVARLVRPDPARRLVICALAWIGGRDVVVGAGAIDLVRDAEPDTLAVRPELADELEPLLRGALQAGADARRRARPERPERGIAALTR